LRVYKQTATGMAEIRERILANPIGFSQELKIIEKMGMRIIGDKFSKKRFEGIGNVGIRDFMNLRNFFISKECPIGDNVFSCGLVEEISTAFDGLCGLYRWLAI